MPLLSLLYTNHYLFLIGTTDNEYNQYFLNHIPQKLNTTDTLVSIESDDFLTAKSYPSALILINKINLYLEKWTSEEIHVFYEKCRLLKTTQKTKVIFFLNPDNLGFTHRHSQIKNLLNKSLYFIPNPDASTQLSFLSSSLSEDLRQHLNKVFEHHTIPKFIIELGAEIIEKFCGQNFSSQNFQEIGGFKGLISLAGNKLEDVLSTAGIQSALVNFFRPFLYVDSANQITLVRQTKEQVVKISKTTKHEVEIFLEEAIKVGFIKEPLPEIFELASKSIVTYWNPFNNWIQQEINLVGKYRELQKLALLYHNQKGQLLSAAQIDELLSWKASFPYSNEWGEQYAHETEIIWNFFDYSILINDAHKEAETRKSRRLIRMTRAIAAIIGIAFILSFVAAIYAGIERKKAELAQNIAEDERLKALQAKEEADLQRMKAEDASKSESLAKIAAEKERQAALTASELAIQEKQNAILAKKNAEEEKEKAELARKEAEKAKVVAEKAREEALIAQEAEKEALAISLKNFENAEKLRLQQLASNMGLTSSQLNREMKYGESLKKAVEAYQLNRDNLGSVYEQAIAKAIIEANTKFHESEFTFEKPIKSIQLSENGLQLACLYLDDELIEFNLESKESHLIASSVNSFVLGKNNSLWITTKTHKILNYNFSNQIIEEKKYPFFDSNIFGVIPVSEIPEKNLIIQENGIFESTGKQVVAFKNHGFKPPSFSINLDQKLLLLKEGHSLSIYNLSPQKTLKKIDALSLPNDEEIMSFDVVGPYNKIVIGDVYGTVYLYDLSLKSLHTLGNIHDSRISFLKAVNVLNTSLIISSSYDHSWKLTPIDLYNNQLEQPITFQAHSGWITSAFYDQPNHQLFTAGNDKTVFIWNINLEEIVKNFNKL